MSSAARATRPPKPAPVPPAVATRPQRRFTVPEYHQLGAAGILTTRDRVELIHGLIVEKPLIRPPHTTAVGNVGRELTRLLGLDAAIRTQQPITLADSEPEPDVVLASGSPNDYGAAHPRPRQVRLVVEVADSSLAYDRTTKLGMYAVAKLPVYWVVNLIDHRVEVYTGPRGGKNPGYKTQTDYGPGDAVPVVVAGTDLGSIPVSELLP